MVSDGKGNDIFLGYRDLEGGDIINSDDIVIDRLSKLENLSFEFLRGIFEVLSSVIFF